MPWFPTLVRRARQLPSSGVFREERGSALLEFAITLPILTVFVVGIFDFSGAFNQKQKIEQAAQEGAIIAGSQPMNDIQPTNPSPDSLQPVVTAVFNTLAAGNVLPNQGKTCAASVATGPQPLGWTYTFTGCSGTYASDNLVININRGWVAGGGPPASVGTVVDVSYPYHWRFNTVIQLLLPGANYAATTQIDETASTHNQI